MSKHISVSDDVLFVLDTESKKNETGQREETYDSVLRRLLKVK